MESFKKNILIGVLVLGMTLPLYAAEERHTAKLVDVKGTVVVQRAEEREWVPAAKGMVLREGDAILTKDNAEARLEVGGLEGEGATVDVGENSDLTLVELVKDEEKQTQSTLLDLAIGKILIKAKKLRGEKSNFEVKTPTSITGIRGTEFSVEVEAIN